MSRIDKLNNMFEVLNNLAEKYPEYKTGDVNKIVFHDPENEEQAQKAKKIASSVQRFLYLALIIFVATAVLMILAKTPIWATVLDIAICIVIGIIAIKSQIQKVQIITVKAIYKNRERMRNSNNSYMYFISVIPDNGEKVIYQRIQISEEDYQKVTEGTPVMIVNKGLKACVL